MLRRFVKVITLAVLVLSLVAGTASAAPGGSNRANAKACQKGGWETLAPSTNPTVAFASQNDCVSYGANGGTIVPRITARVVVIVDAFNGTVCPFTIRLVDAADGTAVGVRVTLSSGATAPPLLSAPNQVESQVFPMLPGEFIASAAAELFAGGVGTGIAVPIEYPTTVCGA